MKRGFTLIELLGVLVILGVLAVITVPLVQSLITGAGEDSRTVQEKAFIKAAKSWAGDHVFNLPEAGSYKSVYLIELISAGYLDANKESGQYYIKKSGTNNEYNLKEACVKISNVSKDNTKAKYEYEFSEDCPPSSVY